MGSSLRDRLVGGRILLLDGSMGAFVQAMDLDVERDFLGRENCTEVLNLSRPELIERIHDQYLAAGADAVETNTFGGASHVLAEFDLADRTREINRVAAEIARRACERVQTPDRPRFVFGSMGPGTKLITLGQIEWARMLTAYTEQARGLIDGGVDAFLIETCQDLLQVKCAINAVLTALDEAGKTTGDIPIFVSVTVETTGTLLVGSSVEAVAAALDGYPIAGLGFNCATGPGPMLEHVRTLRERWGGMISVIPNAGIPELKDGKTCFPLTPDEMVERMRDIIDEGVSIIGGCCGTTPEHIRQLRGLVDEIKIAPEKPAARVARCSSLYSAVELRQETSFLIIGERCNASGSKKFRELLEAEDVDGIVALARSQVREGSHVLDVNVDFAGRDNADDMGTIVAALSRQVDAPLMLDSTQIRTIEAGLERAGGRCIINSANFEDGEEEFDTICTLARGFNAALVIGAIDEDPHEAMARTADRKLQIASRAIERATTVHGMRIEDIFIDPLVLPVSTGMDSDRRSGLATIEGTRAIARAFPRVQLTCGVSNVSFGLKPAARVVLNSVYLHALVEAGMTSAIVHAGKILPLSRIPTEQKQAALAVLYDRRHETRGGTGLPEGVTDQGFDPLGAFIDLFKDVTTKAEQAGPDTRTIEERLRAHIIDGEREHLTGALDEALKRYTPLEIINDHLLDGMKTVGELFGSGQMQLPFVLQSAEVMKKAVAYLEPKLERAEGSARGSIVLATVRGDVHDIGKNLVDIILSNNGFRVYNIGIKQPISDIIAKWRETGADAIGMSGLLVKSVHVMEENLHELNRLGLRVPVLLGGAALSRHYAEGHLRSAYEGDLFYGRDAFEGLRIMELVSVGRGNEIQAQADERVEKRAKAEATVQAARSRCEKGSGGAGVLVRERSDVATDVPVPAAPFFGSRVVTGIDLDEVFRFINTTALFRGQWQFKKGPLSDEQYAELLRNEAEPVFAQLQQQCRQEGLLRPGVVYGYYACASEGDALIVYDAEDHDREIERFTFPRQASGKRLCLADYFRPVESGERDVLALHCVTMGHEISEAAQKLFKGDRYQEYLYLHGLGVEAAEALAELWHAKIRQEMGIAGEDGATVRDLFVQRYRGCRYSFGYPACPEMSDQDKLWRLIDPTRIGCELTENYQIAPEQATSAIIAHHPEARYFATGGSLDS